MRAPFEAAKVYCDDEHVAGVEYSASTHTTKVISSLLGGGTVYYPAKGESFSCPVVGPDSMSDACKRMLDITDWVSVCGGEYVSQSVQSQPGSDPLNTTYLIDGFAFALVNGIAEQPSAPGSAGRDSVSVLGVPTYADLDDDGDDDAALFLRKTGQGSGTFYYLAAARKTSEGFVGTDALFLGDRILPENISIQTGIVTARYTDRSPEENFSIPPSVPRVLYAQIRNDSFVAVSDIPPTAALFFGTLSSGEEYTFRPCDSGASTYRIADDSPFLSDIAVMFGGEAGSVYAVVSATVMNEEVMYIYSLERLSSIASCTSDMIVLDAPRQRSVVSSPLTVSGRARGTWFFEGSFPVMLTNWDGLIIAEGVARAEGDWMTEDFVPFIVTLTFNLPEGGVGIPDTGSLILKKDNPSGLPEHDAALEITVYYP
jgi:hypothetical protein